MRDIILIAPQDFNLAEIKSAFDSNSDYRFVTEKNRLSIEAPQKGVFLEIKKNDDIASYYDDEEGNIFKSSINKPTFFLISFKDLEFSKRVLSLALNRADVYLDNDFGLILPGNQFIALLNERPGWDWALD